MKRPDFAGVPQLPWGDLVDRVPELQQQASAIIAAATAELRRRHLEAGVIRSESDGQRLGIRVCSTPGNAPATAEDH